MTSINRVLTSFLQHKEEKKLLGDIKDENVPLKSKSAKIAIQKLIEAKETKATAKRNLQLVQDSFIIIIKNLRTRDTAITQTRKLYHKFLSLQTIQSILKLSDEERLQKVAGQAKAVKKALENVIHFTADFVGEIIDKLKISTNPFDKVLLLILTTGRRSIEVMSHRFPVPTKAKQDRYITIHKTAKGTKTKERKAFDVPLIRVSFQEMVNCFKLVRARFKDDEKLTNEELTKKYNARLSSRVKKLLMLVMFVYL